MPLVRGTIGKIVETRRNSKDDLSVEWQMQISDFLPSGKVGDLYKSPEFEFSDEWWNMEVCMNGGLWRSVSSEAVRLFLQRKVPEGPPKTVLFTFGVRTPDGVEKSAGFEEEISGIAGCGVRGLWQRSDLMENESRLMPGNVLIITCDLKRVDKDAREAEVPVLPPNLESLSRDFGRLLKGGIHPDVRLKWGGERIVPAHKCVLTARSPAIAGRIRSDMEGANTGLVDISDLGVDVDVFLHYVYTGELPKGVSDDIVPDLYAAADQFDIDALKDSCRDRMVGTLAESNCTDFLTLAEKHGDDAFKKAVIDFIFQKDVLKGEVWKKFAEQSPKLAMEVYDKYVQSHS